MSLLHQLHKQDDEHHRTSPRSIMTVFWQHEKLCPVLGVVLLCFLAISFVSVG